MFLWAPYKSIERLFAISDLTNITIQTFKARKEPSKTTPSTRETSIAITETEEKSSSMYNEAIE